MTFPLALLELYEPYEIEPTITKVRQYVLKIYGKSKMKDNVTPAYEHAFRVGELLEKIPELPVEVVVAGYLHDAVEDNHTSLEKIKTLFGEDVKKYVEEVTLEKNEGEGWRDRTKIKIQKLEKMSEYAKIIKLADKVAILEKIKQEIEEGKNPWEIMNKSTTAGEHKKYYESCLNIFKSDKEIKKYNEVVGLINYMERLINEIWSNTKSKT